jgi:hypothetical protein
MRWPITDVFAQAVSLVAIVRLIARRLWQMTSFGIATPLATRTKMD